MTIDNGQRRPPRRARAIALEETMDPFAVLIRLIDASREWDRLRQRLTPREGRYRSDPRPARRTRT